MQKSDLWQETLFYVNAVVYKEKFFDSQDMIKVQMINKMRTHISKIDFSGIKVTLLISIHVKHYYSGETFCTFRRRVQNNE